jgi:hypothetical protein
LWRRRRPSPPNGWDPPAAGRIARQLADELQLTPDQAARVQADFAQAAANIRTVRGRALREVRPEVGAAVLRAAQDLAPDKREQPRECLRRRFLRAGMEDYAPPPGD